MSAGEGIGRIATTVRYFGYWAGGIIAAAGVWFSRHHNLTNDDRSGMFWGALVVGAALAGVGHLLAWILDGFRPKE